VLQIESKLSPPKNQVSNKPGFSKFESDGAWDGAWERNELPSLPQSENNLGISKTSLASPPPKKRRVARYELQGAAAALLPKERLTACMRRRIKPDEGVNVCLAVETGTAHYGNLMSCGSIWGCPVCAAKISERRRRELAAAVEIWQGRGGVIVLLTFTMRHNLGESCAAVLDALQAAYRSFWSGSPSQKIRAGYGIAGQVRGLEVTWGGSGWHCHIHCLLFLEKRLAKRVLAELESRINKRWRGVLERKGRYASLDYGVKLQTGWLVGDYVTKFGTDDGWTAAHEVAKSHVKGGSGSKKGMTPNQLLRAYLAGDDRAGVLWVEYYWAFKGKLQLVWTRGFRDDLGLGQEKTDEELAELQEENAVILAEIGQTTWKAVLANDARAEVLEVAEKGGTFGLMEFFKGLGVGADVWYPEYARLKYAGEGG
jgi:hypothetical protein